MATRKKVSFEKFYAQHSNQGWSYGEASFEFWVDRLRGEYLNHTKEETDKMISLMKAFLDYELK